MAVDFMKAPLFSLKDAAKVHIDGVIVMKGFLFPSFTFSLQCFLLPDATPTAMDKCRGRTSQPDVMNGGFLLT